MKQGFRLPRIVISAPSGRSGKTTVTLGLLGALREKGVVVQPFKKGPDYIDPSWHTKVAGKTCRNLDCFLMEKEIVKKAFMRSAIDAEVSIIEGAMGLFDGFDIEGTGSTAEIAKILSAPVILVVDTRRMTRSIAPLVQGFQSFDSDIQISGVILNQVARARHEKMLTTAVEKYCGIPVVGSIPKDEKLLIPDRHLGLVPADEGEKYYSALAYISNVVRENVNLDQLQRIADGAPLLMGEKQELTLAPREHTMKIGVIRDKVFSFYYPENVEALQLLGAEIVEINSLEDHELPKVDGLYIGGGFPEVFAAELEKNSSLRRSVRDQAELGLPIYAECGGLMYLADRILTEGKSFAMAGVLPMDIIMEKKPQGHGYTLLSVQTPTDYYMEKERIIKSHEFHHSRIARLNKKQVQYAFNVNRGNGLDGKNEGLLYKNVFASYSHVHALSTPEWAEGFVRVIKNKKK